MADKVIRQIWLIYLKKHEKNLHTSTIYIQLHTAVYSYNTWYESFALITENTKLLKRRIKSFLLLFFFFLNKQKKTGQCCILRNLIHQHWLSRDSGNMSLLQHLQLQHLQQQQQASIYSCCQVLTIAEDKWTAAFVTGSLSSCELSSSW